jgi:hypothetical protein
MYHSILLCGSKHETAGRNIAGYRLRTAARKLGYNSLVLDSATSMTASELESVLDNTITDQTLCLGISTVWLNGPSAADVGVDWCTKEFFKRIKTKFPKLKIVAGGVGLLKLRGSRAIYDAADWHVTGFSDDSFPRLLMLLEGKSGHGLRYFVDNNGRRTIDSNRAHKITDPNEIETVLEADDGFLSYQPIPLEVSRGCIFRCVFCNHPFTGAKDADSYIRTPESIANELRRNYDLFGTTRYSLMDDTFNDSFEKLDRLEKAIDLAKLPNFEFQAYTKPELLVTKPAMIDQLIRLGIVGGFAGIESLNSRARKEMNKGMDVQRVFDALSDLTSKSSKVKLHASIIVGLPGDLLSDIEEWQSFFIKNQSTLFRSWEYAALGIYQPLTVEQDNTNLSPIEKDPEKYGYQIIKNEPGKYIHWKNESMDTEQASQISAKLNKATRHVATPGGWTVSSAWNVNETEEAMNTTTLAKLQIESKSMQSARLRAIATVKKLTNK